MRVAPAPTGPVLDVQPWAPGRRFLRVSDDARGSTEFNPCRGAPTRFAPLWVAGECVPTLYGAETLDAVLMETAFHDVVLAITPDRPPEVHLADLETRRRSTVSPRRELRLGRLDDQALEALGVDRAELVDTDAATYHQTVAWAASAHLHGAADGTPLDGLLWHSRRAAEALGARETAFVLFGDRVDRSHLTSAAAPVPLVADTGLDELDSLATRLGVTLVR